MRRLAFLLLLPAVFGCPTKQPKPTVAEGVAPAATIQAGSTGAAPNALTFASKDPSSSDLTGRITLEDELPRARKIQITKDADTCGAASSVIDVKGVDGGVADVVIEVKGIDAPEDTPWEWAIPKEGYVIRQKDCAFIPRMIVIPSGEKVTVFNDDPVGHNVNTGAWNQMQPAGADPIIETVEGKSVIKVGCNIHSWMEGWLYPAESPYYAVTDDNGEYRIEGIPPGKYRVSIWHPYLGQERERITFEAGLTATLDHEFEAPAK